MTHPDLLPYNYRRRGRSITALVLISAALLYVSGCATQPASGTNPRPEPVTEWWDLSIGMTKAEVMDMKGKPTRDLSSSLVYITITQDELEAHFVTFDAEGMLRNVCTSQGTSRLLGLSIGDSESQLLARLGPAEFTRTDDETSKRLYYPRYGANFGISNDAIDLLCIGWSYRQGAAEDSA